MKKTLYEQIFDNNKAWVDKHMANDKDYFSNLAKGQTPEVLYIGCSDSRVPANEMMGLGPGEVFVHRNVANLVVNTDMNIASVIHYAVVHLKVKEIVVCGHYGCGGVNASMLAKDLGILNGWLRNIRDVYRLHKEELDSIEDNKKKFDRLVELNVQEQCLNVIKMAEVQESYLQNGFPKVHGWVMDLATGYIKDLNLDFDKLLAHIQSVYNLTDQDFVSIADGMSKK